MKKTLISMFTGHCFIIATNGTQFFTSTDTETHDFTEIDKFTYDECFESPLVQNIIKL